MQDMPSRWLLKHSEDGKSCMDIDEIQKYFKNQTGKKFSKDDIREYMSQMSFKPITNKTPKEGVKYNAYWVMRDPQK